jgi:hypothetical protein
MRCVSRCPDEIVLHVVPLLLGGGTRLFGPQLEPVPLERLYVGQSGDSIDVRYRDSLRASASTAGDSDDDLAVLA